MRERGQMLAKRALAIWPHHWASAERVRAAHLDDLRAEAMDRGSGSLTMSDSVRKLLDSAENALVGLGNVIRVVRRRSVCCYVPEFLVEMTPMRSDLRLILPFDDVDEVEVPGDLHLWTQRTSSSSPTDTTRIATWWSTSPAKRSFNRRYP